MFHVKHLLLLLFSFPLIVFAQGSMELEEKPFILRQSRDKQVDSFLANYKSLQNYSQEEQALFYWVNLLRSNPPLFRKQIIDPFLDQFPEANTNNAKTLIADLDKQDPISLVAPNQLLSETCREHAYDLAYKQKGISHSSSDGRNFQQRMKDAGVTNCAGENILEGNEDALKAVIMLLIDQGVPGLGHRKSLLNPSFDLMGCCIIPKKKNENHIMVQLFSCR